MIEIEELEELIYGLSINYSNEEIDTLYEEFKRDFVDNKFYVDGLKVKVILHNSKVDGFESYPETFVHLITRKSESKKRVFDPFRANRIHWVKQILLQPRHDDVKYFEFTMGNGRVRDHYWYEEEDFIVIMEKINPNYMVITSFHVDGQYQRNQYQKKYLNYKKNIGA